jgi:amino acid adenylation domain-containing protein
MAAGSLLHYKVATLLANQHLLFFSVPALYADITGLKNLVSQVSHFYASNGQSSDASPLQYADLAEWQNQLLEDEDRNLERSYWVKQTSQELLTVKLPFEQRRLENAQFDPCFHTRRIDADRVTSIRAMVESYHISLDLILLVCWQILLGRLTGQPTVMIGFANEGRKYAELQDVIGLFTKYLPLQCQVDETLPIRQLWRQVQQAVNDAHLGHEYFSWDHIANETDNQTDAFLPFCFDFTEPRAEYSAGDVSFCINQHYSCVDRFKIKLSCWIQDDVLITEFHYDANDYLEIDIQRLADQFQTLLENILDNPEATIRELEILGASERQQLLIDFNATKTEYPDDRLIHTLFENQCDSTPNSIAVVFESQQLTYAELNTQANQLAHHLQTVGVRPEMPVAICMERSLEMIVGILGILKAGGAYVPLDPTYPSDRLAFILQDTQSPVLLTQHGLIDKLPDHQHAKALCLDADRESWSNASPANPISDVTSDRLAYIIYTSGSTGQPKGVMVTHQNLVHSTTARFNYYHEPLSNFLLLSSFSFDSSIAGIFWTLCQGATLVLPQPNMQQDPGKIVHLIAQQQISHLLCLPSLYALVLAQAPPQQLASLRTAIVAGELCLATLVNLHYEQLPQATLFNEYGPTEATVWSSVHRCQPQDLELSVPIGHPISNTQIYLLDDQQRLVPIGVPGELYVGGEGVARGYLNRPDLTSEKFVTNPFSDQPTARLYRTGDLARYRPDGSLEFLDRIDQQVKIRGFRIELGEIEGILTQHPHIQDAVVLSWADPAGIHRT